MKTAMNVICLTACLLISVASIVGCGSGGSTTDRMGKESMSGGAMEGDKMGEHKMGMESKMNDKMEPMKMGAGKMADEKMEPK